jgi:hypothetical protein
VSENQGDESLLDVLIALAQGKYSLWVSPDVCAVLQVLTYPQQKVLLVAYAGGQGLDAMAKAFEFAKGLARENKIDVVRVFGRQGWEKVLGIKRVGVILQVEV